MSEAERGELNALLSGGRRAQILLAADAGAGDEDMATSVAVGGSTRTKRSFVEGNLEKALRKDPRPGASRSPLIAVGDRGSWLRRAFSREHDDQKV